ncbi:hypothetical protein LPH45_02170 [Xylella taiwanensis]|uniref:Peptidase S1 domain-containing protein n=1 Tax=Xylella taiwanensis TaxID=1444770 RepID=Z9JJ78_9GAMM|nr:hypothetical protein [Xylella taiwanensis]AXI83963.1 hypothetical protein AB672_08460 [Xylella taiwanensis]EWS77822.1 hypothetical protein AF72_08575 [Xylella taiwanensis]UFM94142.1 hypothetical protein LPH39_02295 [Xylella taiwanensis]UFN09489.1 hypothetical protein LPH45_02170 [Xylella taiwanensis]UFS54534.1 hypothetical protein LPH53_02380 [Xylella taiwanensis]
MEDADSHKDDASTAQSVTSNQVLMTAVHCLMNLQGYWRTHVTFAPRIRGKERFKNSGTSCKAIFGGWLIGGVESHV